MSFHSVVIQKLLNANAHIGRQVTAHHFKIFTEGTRNSVSIIDSDKTLICLRNACNFIGYLARNNGRLLFVNTNSLFDEIIAQMTRTTGIKHDTTWRLGGFLTNSSSPRKYRGRNKKFNLCAAQPPDCIVIFDTERKTSVIREAYRLQIPIVGLVDPSTPWETYKKITYPVPANDSMEFVYMFCNLITKTILKERKEAMAEKGITGGDVEPADQTDQTVEKFVLPYETLPPVPEEDVSQTELLDKLVIVKFNGSLGTRIGSNGPKCVMEIGDGLTCLDLIINQIEALNAKYGCNIPLLLVNAESVHRGVLKFLEKHPNKNIHSVLESSLEPDTPSNFAQDDEDEMNSSNFAEILHPLLENEQLDILSSQGKEYILMLGSDNLAHVIDPKILYHIMENNIDICLEVMPKSSEIEEIKNLQNEEETPVMPKSSEIEEIKNSHNEEETSVLTPKKNWKFTNTMWLSIESVESLVERALKGKLTISKLFDQHLALNVPKSRYLPVEGTSDLFLLQSNLYTLSEGTLTRNAARENPADPSIELGPLFNNVDDFKERFKSIPSILELDSLEVIGDVWFGADITLKGKVSVHAEPRTRIEIPDGAVLEDTIITSQEDVGQVSPHLSQNID